MDVKKQDFCIITFSSGEPYLSESENLQALCEQSGIQFKLYTFEWLKTTSFYKENKPLLDSRKAGFCAWKPFIILDALKQYKKILYLDSSMLFNKDHIQEFINLNDTLLSTETALKNVFYTKQETFEIMDAVSDRYMDAYQVWAGVILATMKAEPLLKEWLYYCKIRECISNEGNKEKNPLVRYHLFDQSIYSILYERHLMERTENYRINYDANDYYYFFIDTREESHIPIVVRDFGEDIIVKQDNLIMNFFPEYETNGSCCYIPENSLERV